MNSIAAKKMDLEFAAANLSNKMTNNGLTMQVSRHSIINKKDGEEGRGEATVCVCGQEITS